MDIQHGTSSLAVRGKSRARYSSVLADGPLRDTVFQLRYRSYIADNYIETNETMRFFDEFDHQKNCSSYLAYAGEEILGSIRSCVYRPGDSLKVPAMEIFHDELGFELGYDKAFIEANKFVVSPEFQRRGGIRARFQLYRNIVGTAIAEEVERIVVAVRPEHVKFYKMLYFSPISEIKSYPHLKFKTVLLACYNMKALKAFIWSKTEAH